MQNLTERIVEYENGQLDQQQTIQLFQELVDSGLIMQLQGHYGRLAFQLMEYLANKPPAGRHICYKMKIC